MSLSSKKVEGGGGGGGGGSDKRRHAGSPSKSGPRILKNDDWHEVTEPVERRRIQNRLAQRKFREKLKENKGKAERDSGNREHAGRTYHIPDADEVLGDADGELSGLPWGSISMRHVIAQGHEKEGQRSSGRGGYYAPAGDAGRVPDNAQCTSPDAADANAVDASSPVPCHQRSQAIYVSGAGDEMAYYPDGHAQYSYFLYDQDAAARGHQYQDHQ